MATNDISMKDNSTKPKITLSFELSRSGLVLLNKAEAKVEELVVVEEKPPVVKKPKVLKVTTPNVTTSQSETETDSELNNTDTTTTTTDGNE